MTRTAWIHVGTDKTGSTTLQQYFHQNRVLLEGAFDLLYAPGANHAALPVSYLEKPEQYSYFKNKGMSEPAAIKLQIEKESKNLNKWLDNNPKKDVLFSFEGLIHLQPSEFKLLVADFRKRGFDRVAAVYYARPHCGYAASAISQRVKMGKLPMEGLNVPAIDHVRILTGLKTVFQSNDLIVRPFIPKQFPKKDLVYDFLMGALNIPVKNELEKAAPVERQNESLSLFGIQLGSKIIEKLGLLEVQIPPAEFNKTLGTMLSKFPGPKYELSTLSQEILFKQTRHITAWMKEQFQFDLDDFSQEGAGKNQSTGRLESSHLLLADALANYAIDCLRTN